MVNTMPVPVLDPTPLNSLLCPRCPTPDTRKLGPVLARRALLLWPIVAAAVVISVTAWGTVGPIAARTDAGRSLGANGFFVGGGYDFNREVKPGIHDMNMNV